MSARIVVAPDRCIGAGQCVLVDPEAFDQSDEDGLVVLLKETAETGEALARAREAVQVCPSRTLSLAE